MAYGSNNKKKPCNCMKKKGQLTQRQKDTMKKHSVHHTKKHMAHMTKLMKEGKTFTEAHKITMKKIGK